MLCHRNVLHACMRLTFVRATCAMPCPLKPSCTAAPCLHGQIFAQGVPVHCLAIDWLCIATLQSRHKSATQLTPASPYLIRWYSGKSVKNPGYYNCLILEYGFGIFLPDAKLISPTTMKNMFFHLVDFNEYKVYLFVFSSPPPGHLKIFEEDLKNILPISYPHKI